MRQTIWTSGSPSNPQAFITKRKQRVKQFEGQVFLNDGDEYEIEIFNPTPTHILAKIKVDNNYLSGGGIVLRPGERVFLERFLDTNNKFVFRTYEVGKEAVNLGAIDNNGYVEIEFYNEYQQNLGYWYNGGSITTYTAPISSGTYTLGNATFTTSGTNLCYNNTSLTSTNSNIKTFVSQTQDVFTPISKTNSVFTAKSLGKVETGTTEKGDTSKQTFTTSNKTFSSYAFHNVTWRILPTSQKQYHKEELNVLYCGECGSKRKKDTYKFCPHCGTKF